MANINELSATSASEVSGSDLLVLFTTANGDSRKLSLTNFLTWLNTNFARTDYVTTIVVPTNGFNQAVEDDGLNRHLLLRPAGTLATGTVVLPSSTNATDGQEILVTTKEEITSLTVNGNGATEVNGEPSTLTAGGFFTLRYNTQTSSWNRVA